MSANPPIDHQVMGIRWGLSPHASSFNLLTALKKLQTVYLILVNMSTGNSWKSSVRHPVKLHTSTVPLQPFVFSRHTNMRLNAEFQFYILVRTINHGVVNIVPAFGQSSNNKWWWWVWLVGSGLKADSYPKSVGLLWGLTATWHHVCIHQMNCSFDECRQNLTVAMQWQQHHKHWCYCFIAINTTCINITTIVFSAFTLLTGCQEEHPACKKQ